MPSDYAPPSPQVLRWVERSVGGRVITTQRLLGGITAAMDRVTIATPAGAHRDVVLRRWQRGGHGLVERESAALQAMADHGVPTPEFLGSGEIAGGSCLLMTALPGEPLLVPDDGTDWLRSMATTLARIHAVPVRLEPTDPHKLRDDADLGWLGDAELARVARTAADEALSLSADVLVHGDYQQLNILWQDGALSGVVDWTYTGQGRKEIDVGHCRLALAVLFDVEVAEEFLRCYAAESGVDVDPRGDLRALLTFGPDWTSMVPRQLVGRAKLDTAGMAGRVTTLVRRTVARLA